VKKKAAGLPVWAWIAILAAGAYLLYKYEKDKGEGEEEGSYPSTGLEPSTEGGSTGTSSGGIGTPAQAAEEGYVPAGSEAAKEKPSAIESALEQILGEKLAPAVTAPLKTGKSKAQKEEARLRARIKKVEQAKKRKKPTKRTRVKRPGQTHTSTTHLAPTNHKAAVHPKARIKKAKRVRA